MTSLLLLATPFLIQARMSLAFLATRAHLLAHVQLLSPVPPGPFLPGHYPATPSPAYKGAGVYCGKMQDLALRLNKLHLVRLCPSIQPFQISLQSPPTFQQIDIRSQLSVIREFTNERFNTLNHIINKNIEQNWPQHRLLMDTTGAWLPAGCSAIDHHSLGLAIQPVPNPAKCSCPSQGLPALILTNQVISVCKSKPVS
ncbi:hypothetical protein DUI87_12676 [Hirundo rustica rustica]|uniref:Uncharacterized protein n=1 Tax=Hirundo rustica rustica TaxID=333673 RepID=A0A3M0K9Q7_HIRRU|nr:hypothetical protein DUI87_12676 [Hirundo rustica rustica]